jgi:hypothetical protein
MNLEGQDCKWAFLGFEAAGGEQPVQLWFNTLPADHRDVIKDRLAFLQVTPRSNWDEPFFDPLIGEGGISEIRFDPIKCVRGKFYYRIYGFFGPEEDESYKFLHATNKKSRNDTHGKAIAKKRLRQLQSGEARLHKFDMDEEGSFEAAREKPPSEN